jgi:protein-S-isoprenylcysteine O-methyltransferase Ste14
MMAASNFEFKYRFWLFGALFGTAYSTYGIDHVPAGIALGNWITRLRGTAATNMDYHVVFAIGALLCLAASLVRTWATAYLNSEVMVGMRLDTSRLVADGPYRYVRNPLYFGNILLAVGMGLLASRIGFLILVAGMIVYDY